LSERAYHGVLWGLTTTWALLGLAQAVLAFHGSDGSYPFFFVASTASSGALTGVLAGLATAAMARAAGGLLIGALVGHLLVAPPAAQLGQWAEHSLAPWLPFYLLGPLSFLGYAAVFAAVAAAVLVAGSALGIALEALVRAALRTFLPRFALASGRWRPRWRTLRIAVLVALLGGALVHADRRKGLPWPQAAPPAQSAWLERERSVFRDVLARQRYELIVLPVQAIEPSFDRIARSLMTRSLAQRAEERTGLRMPDPTLLARALGARERSFDLGQALRLAGLLGAERVLVSTVKRTGSTFELRASLWERASAGAAWQEAQSGTLERLPFHDRLPPSVSLRASLDALLDELELGEARPAAREAASAPGPQPIGDLARLAAAEGGSALEHALRLQVLAALHERESLEAETLWERSLLALWRVEGSAELVRVLEARAWLHLARRPYALERLGVPASPAGRALAAALNGDLPGLEAAAAAIEERDLRLLSEIELADVYDAFGVHKRLLERRKAVLEPAWTEPAVLALRLSAPDGFRPELHTHVAKVLADIAPVRMGWRETASAWLRWLYWRGESLDSGNLWLARAVESTLAPVWIDRAADWAGRRAADRPAPWDYYDLMFAANRSALLKTVYGTLHFQGMPERAAAMIDELGALYQGYPRLMYYQAWALDRMGRKALPGPQQRLFSRSSALAVSAYKWEGGESHLAQSVEYYIYERPYRKYLDEPPRRYRVEVPAERLQFERTAYAPQEMQRRIADARRRLDYSDRHAEPLRELVRWLRRAGQAKEADAAIAANRHRFVGTRERAELLSEALDAGSWDERFRRARDALEGGKAIEAQRALLQFPGFKDHSGHNIVGLSNWAFDAGEYLYRRGEPELARALFYQSTELGTGSARELHSRELLAVLESDLETALSQARDQLERYNDGAASMRVVLYQHLLGRSDAAWSEFSGFASRFDHRPWAAAFVGHRMQGVEGRALEAWLAGERQRDTTRDYLTRALRERHAFMLAFIDRKPGDEALEHVRRVARANNNSPFYPQLAEGYIALRKGDHATAAARMAGPHRDLYNISVNRRESLSEWLPHMVLAHSRSGNANAADALLGEHRLNIGSDYDYLVAYALLEGRAGRHEAAAASLRLALFRLPPLSTRSFPPGYSLLEAAELLHAESGAAPYRALIEDVARRLQVEVPYSWAAAFEAKYARDAQARATALAAASLLDPGSERIAHFGAAERQAARAAAAKQPAIGVRAALLRLASRSKS
jgi:hypothetical protein